MRLWQRGEKCGITAPAQGCGAEPADTKAMRNLKKIVGKVVSTSMDKTAVVEVESFYIHSLYRKVMRRARKHVAHDEHEVCRVGDTVQLKFAGQMSKKKRWAVVDMLRRQPQLQGETFPMSKLAGSTAAFPPMHPADVPHPQKPANAAAAASSER